MSGEELRAALTQARDRFESMGGHMKPDWTAEDRESLATDWWFGLQEIEAALAAPSTPEPSETPPVPWTTINVDVQKWGLREPINRALIGKFTPSRRELLVNNLVSAVARWREAFRDCGCWRKGDGFALCDWHERLFQSQRAEAVKLGAAPSTEPALDVATVHAALTATGGCDHSDWRANGARCVDLIARLAESQP